LSPMYCHPGELVPGVRLKALQPDVDQIRGTKSRALGQLCMMAPRGFRALVTRPREDAKCLAEALAARGVAALIEPLLEIRLRSAETLDLRGVQAVLCTSSNGVRALARANGDRRVPLLVVGDATAARARAEGFEAVESAAGNADDLARLAATRLRPDNGRLLHVAGDITGADPLGFLRAQGFTVDRRVLYEAHAAAGLSVAAVAGLRAGGIAFALFFSPRTAAIFARLAAAAGVVRCCSTITALSLSKAVDDAFGVMPWRERLIAERPNQPALLAALDRVLGERSGIDQD
jgi:uroporphyrinogen-III synthase